MLFKLVHPIVDLIDNAESASVLAGHLRNDGHNVHDTTSSAAEQQKWSKTSCKIIKTCNQT